MITTRTIICLKRVRILNGQTVHEIKLQDGRWISAETANQHLPAVVR